MQKEKLIETLMNASRVEEDHSNFIAKTFMETFNWSDLDERKAKRAKEILNKIRIQSHEHNVLLNDILNYVQRTGKNEY